MLCLQGPDPQDVAVDEFIGFVLAGGFGVDAEVWLGGIGHRQLFLVKRPVRRSSKE